MLNISSNTIKDKINFREYDTILKVENKVSSQVLIKLIAVVSLLLILILFLPWTQNVRSTGRVTTLKPNQRPQTINTLIAGRIDRWYVQEGDMVMKGDTIVKLSEIKDKYLDPDLLKNTQEQLALNVDKANSYGEKIAAQNDQLTAILRQRDMKIQQTRIKLDQMKLKLQNDSLAYLAANLNYETALYQFQRMDSLYGMGLKSLTSLEKRKIKMQETKAYETSAKNKWLNTKNEILSLTIEISQLEMKFQKDASKIRSDIFSATSDKLASETSVNKLRNIYSNYSIRNNMYYILAPQDGYIAQTFYSGIGETIKEAHPIVSIMPNNYDLAVELYIKPIDLPLIEKGRKVQIQFDGWPAIVFSGWPNVSKGTYEGEIYAIDQFISENGKFRILVKQDSSEYAWPSALRFGAGTSNMILLKDVPVWYELWRNINGFPPDFYTSKGTNTINKEKK